MNEIQYYDHAEASAEAECVSNLERERDEMLAALRTITGHLGIRAALLREGYAEQLDAARAAIARTETKPMDTAHLINAAVAQIKRDFEAGDETAIVELLANIPVDSLSAFLSEA